LLTAIMLSSSMCGGEDKEVIGFTTEEKKYLGELIKANPNPAKIAAPPVRDQINGLDAAGKAALLNTLGVPADVVTKKDLHGELKGLKLTMADPKDNTKIVLTQEVAELVDLIGKIRAVDFSGAAGGKVVKFTNTGANSQITAVGV